MANHNQPALVVLQKVLQPHHAVGIEVVGGLIEQHCRGVRKQNSRQLDSPALATRERLERLVEGGPADTEVARYRRCLSLSGIAPGLLKLLLSARILAHRGISELKVFAGHIVRGIAHAQCNVTQPTRVQDTGACKLFWVTASRVLRQVADFATGCYPTGGGLALTRQNLGEGGLAGAIAPHQPNLVALLNAKIYARHQSSGTDANLKVLHRYQGLAPKQIG